MGLLDRFRRRDPAETVAKLKGKVEDAVRLLGADHPTTLQFRDLYAWHLGEAGDASGAAREYKRLVTHRRRLFGADDPDALDACERLGWWRAKWDMLGGGCV